MMMQSHLCYEHRFSHWNGPSRSSWSSTGTAVQRAVAGTGGISLDEGAALFGGHGGSALGLGASDAFENDGNDIR